MKKSKNLEQFKNILPYQSEMFGVYQPLIGWKSKRIIDRFSPKNNNSFNERFEQLTKYFESTTSVGIDTKSCELGKFNVGIVNFKDTQSTLKQNSVLLQELSKNLNKKPAHTIEEWRSFFNENKLETILESSVFPIYQNEFGVKCRTMQLSRNGPSELMMFDLKNRIIQKLKFESEIVGVLNELIQNYDITLLSKLFYSEVALNPKDGFGNDLKELDIDLPNNISDPYLTFDPHKDIKNVSLSPLGIVHLFRQFFFEFDTFLGTPTGHVWMAPGSTVELIEVSQRKTITEKYYESSYERITKTEKSTTQQDEISEAVKKENQSDLKLGFSTTVNQSWGTGSASATGSINMDTTQQVARETTHKRMREQTEKLSAEIRENYKSTFKTITEITDTSSKRYVLNNNTAELINYELRRKMRQVGVQVQDIGSYLCWETYVDEPGKNLGLANLLHISKPADLIPLPPATAVAVRPEKIVPFTIQLSWDFDERQFNEVHFDVGYEFIPITYYQIPPAEEGYELKIEGFHKQISELDRLPQPVQDVISKMTFIPLIQISGEGEGFHGVWAFTGMFTPDGQLRVGVHATPIHGLSWGKRVQFNVGGTVKYVPIQTPNTQVEDEKKAKEATEANNRSTKDAYLKTVKERVEQASNITKRKFEDLREEERTVVYRNLIGELMTDSFYDKNHPDARTEEGDRDRHVMAELINSIFDVNKMLYFVAPEWWQPRSHPTFIGVNDLSLMSNDAIVSWGDNQYRPNNYLITDKSQPAPFGSSLGWLLQLDGDDLRNAFLNAPWVKAVIPVRPGKELAAMAWLNNVGVEGSEGLDNAYSASSDELAEIRSKLLKLDANDVVKDHEQVTIGDAIRFLCTQVSQKHQQSNRPDEYPKGAEIHDDYKVSATPIDKVYEYGFYPLQKSFRYNPSDTDPSNPDRNFQVFDQWVEILPTDQVVPVEVKYDPLTGQQI